MLAVLLERWRQAQQVAFGETAAGAASRRATRGLPSVSVPVLSTTRVSTAQRFERFGVLKRMPVLRPSPMPTMIDIGVASPSAHGQAIISTATALTRPYASAGAGRPDGPDEERDDRMPDHDGGTK